MTLGAGSPGVAALYKWTDANGRVVYSDQPPPPNVKAETLTPPPPPANPNAARELAQQELERKQREAKRAETEQKEQKDQKARDDADARRTQCTQARGQIGQLSASQVLLYQTNEKGERVVMDDAARRSEIERLQAWIRENCNNVP